MCFWSTRLLAAQFVCSTLKMSTRCDQKQAHATIDVRSQHRINARQPPSCRARPMNADDSLEDIWWIRGLGGKRLPAVSYALLHKKKCLFWHRRGIEIFCHLFSTHQRPNVLYQTPGRLLPHITGCSVNIVTLGWVGALTERAPFRCHNAVVAFVDRWLSRTRNLTASNQTVRRVFLGRSCPNLRPRIVFFIGFCLGQIRANRERYRNITEGIFEI